MLTSKEQLLWMCSKLRSEFNYARAIMGKVAEIDALAGKLDGAQCVVIVDLLKERDIKSLGIYLRLLKRKEANEKERAGYVTESGKESGVESSS